MRLNQTIDCPGCHTEINPFIYKDDKTVKECRCPCCEEQFNIRCSSLKMVNDPIVGNYAIQEWMVVGSHSN